jgi:hypothetical protein
MKNPIACALAVAAIAALTTQAARAQSTPDRAQVLRAAADALGMVRWSDIGAGSTRLPGIDAINTMEFEGSGTSESAGRPVETQVHVALGYNPPAMRVQTTRTDTSGASRGTIETVREQYAWDESEVGAGLVPGEGTATPAMAALRERQLALWTLPYGVVKAALAAGEKTTVAREGGAMVITFPLSGALAGITVTATLDSDNLITRVETRPDNASLASLATQTDYSNYADRGEVLTDIKSPGHITRRRGGRTTLDIEVSSWEANNPYLVFPVPPVVKEAAAANSH